ncbi:S-adenosylmethionine:tRNA ribosyltransferase-isomerase [Nocardiopsis halotolerans]|uniref:S-adenosylmethionine:tRNA ribosyltransferase-isomerase n=1 Tax=Nocardiopsis halotolerans TaxID=124252 RepID=UPI000345DAEF|nr:S-adenosylmethionine:tRNA ribosyltransferase-isomerase [Nocardiopsis halotolerans]
MRTEDFDFDTGTRVMPADPVELRGRSRENGRMVVLDRSTDSIEHTVFSRIEDHLRPGDLLVLNDSYMLSNTLAFRHGDGTLDLNVYGHEPDGATIVKITAGQRLSPGTALTSVDDDQLTCTLIEPQPDDLWKVRFEPAERLIEALDQYGRRVDENIHLDPTSWRTKPDAYRSVYARKPGSLEIPSAGLHFSKELLDRVAAKGVELAYITLHVGATEVLAVRHISAENVEDHEVRPEYFEVGAEAAEQLNRAMAERRRVVAVGTTVMRTLESLMVGKEPGTTVRPQTNWTDLYIYPGFRFKVIDVLLTNLHRPRSSHIVLTAAFGGKELVMRSYAEIIDKGGYEFDMFGDSMLIL